MIKSLSAPLLLAFFYFMTFSTSLAQLSQPGMPIGLDPLKAGGLPEIKMSVLKEIDLKKIMEEDKVLDTIRDMPFRFGENIYVDYNPENSGSWEMLEDGSKLWRLGIKSKGAVSINLAFNRYHLPEGARLFIYTPDGEHIIGAFSHLNNQEDGYFATTLLPGDQVIIEYYEPADVEFKGELNLWRVTHGYRGPGEYFSKGFGDAGWCNLNVACPESEGWEDQIRSVGMLVTGGNGFCSGVLINNAESDGTPYFLSANHCYRNPATIVVWFNWQSETCANPATVPPHDAMSGAVDRARHSTSDFWLMEFNQAIPEDYNVYFSGWNRTLDSEIEGVITGIHHPRADIKKFSWAEGGVQAASYLGNPGSGTSHWHIGPWDGGTTTEPGSSGSPIFDPQGRILGQLHGGYAACGNLLSDWYGRIGISWTGGGTDATRMSTWLDPFNTGVEAVFGFDPILDAAEPDAPAAVSDFTVVADESGELSALLSWTNPVLTFEGEPLTLLDTIFIYRDGEELVFFTGIEPGEYMEYHDEEIDDNGTYLYRIRAVNHAGYGPPVNLSVYIGHDLPAAVSNINLEDIDNNGSLTWDAPTEGQNGGFYLPSSLIEYQITRNPDGATFTIDGGETAFLDETLPGIGFYSYTIVPVNHVGAGGSATSEEVLLAAEGAVFMFNGTVTTCEGTFFDSGGPDNDYQNNEDFTITFFPETEGAKINMQFTSFNTEANYDFLYVYDGDEVSSELLVGQFSGAGVPEPLQDITSTHHTGALTFRFTSDFSITRPGWEATISCYIPADDDLAAMSVSGNLTPSVGQESVYTVKVSNPGFASQNDYLVRLITSDLEELASVSGPQINAGELLEIEIPWTPQSNHQGDLSISGEVLLEGDANPGNNKTPPLSINVMPEGTLAVTIGTGNELPNYRIPFDFYWRNSLAQTIYYDDELLLEQGLITGIAFYSNFSSNLPQRPVRIYMQHTQLEDLAGGFIPVTDDQLVFEGEIDFPSGDNTIFIPFEEGFYYQGGHLLLTTNRLYEQQFHTINEKFYITSTPSLPNRTVQFNSDNITIDPENPPTTGSIVNRDAHANTTFFFDPGYDPDLFTVTFRVDMGNVPYLIFDDFYDNLYITGSILDWAEPGSIPDMQLMEPLNESEGIYTATFELPPGEYEYKYFINEGWEGGEWEAWPNRTVQVSGDMVVYDMFAIMPGSDPWKFARVQFIHNSPLDDPRDIDIFINNRPFIEGLSFRQATPFMEIPIGYHFPLEVKIAMGDKENSIYSENIHFNAETSHIAILTGLMEEEGYTPYQPFEIKMHEGRENSASTGNTDLLLFHGSTDLQAVSYSLEDTGDTLTTNFNYGQFSGYHELQTYDYLLNMHTSEWGTGEYGAQFHTWGMENKGVVILSSGFASQANNSNGPPVSLFAALPQGGDLLELPILTNIIDDPGNLHSELVLFPNPAHEMIYINSRHNLEEISLWNNKGHLITRKNIKGVSASINISGINPGYYTVQIKTSEGLVFRKLIIGN